MRRSSLTVLVLSATCLATSAWAKFGISKTKITLPSVIWAEPTALFAIVGLGYVPIRPPPAA
jgi:hypothetical protein